MNQQPQADKQIQELEGKLVDLLKDGLRPLGEQAGPLLYELQGLRNQQGRRGEEGFTKFVTQKLGLALSTAYDWIEKHKVRTGISVPKIKPFPKIGKGKQGNNIPVPECNEEDLERFNGTPYIRDLSLFSYDNAAEIVEMCEDEDLRNFLGAVDRYDCAYRAVKFAYTEAKAKNGAHSDGTSKEDRSADV
jgi:hypothetical protein